MCQYNTLNNFQLKKLKAGIKHGTEVTLKLSLNVVGDSNDENNFSNKFQNFVKSLQKVHQVI